MPPKRNPLNLNPLQLRSLTLLQALARLPNVGQQRPDGSVVFLLFPDAHGDHFHLGEAEVSRLVVSGMYNEEEWNALSRKGEAKADYKSEIALTPEGQNYDTGDAASILQRGGGH